MPRIATRDFTSCRFDIAELLLKNDVEPVNDQQIRHLSRPLGAPLRLAYQHSWRGKSIRVVALLCTRKAIVKAIIRLNNHVAALKRDRIHRPLKVDLIITNENLGETDCYDVRKQLGTHAIL